MSPLLSKSAVAAPFEISYGARETLRLSGFEAESEPAAAGFEIDLKFGKHPSQVLEGILDGAFGARKTLSATDKHSHYLLCSVCAARSLISVTKGISGLKEPVDNVMNVCKIIRALLKWNEITTCLRNAHLREERLEAFEWIEY